MSSSIRAAGALALGALVVAVAALTVRAGPAMTNVISAVKGLGIDEKDLQTTSIDLSPVYSNASPAKITGYRMSEQLQVTVRDLDKAGDVVDTATAKGATDVNGLWFEVADPDKAMDDA